MKRRMIGILAALSLCLIGMAPLQAADPTNCEIGVLKYEAVDILETVMNGDANVYPYEYKIIQYDGTTGIEYQHTERHLSAFHTQELGGLANTMEADGWWTTVDGALIMQNYWFRLRDRNSATNLSEITDPALTCLYATTLPPRFEYCNFRLRVNSSANEGEVDNELLMDPSVCDTNTFPRRDYHTRFAKTVPYALLQGAPDPGQLYFVKFTVTTSKHNRCPGNEDESGNGSIPLVCTNYSLTFGTPDYGADGPKPLDLSGIHGPVIPDWDWWVYQSRTGWSLFWNEINDAYFRVMGNDLVSDPFTWFEETEASLRINGWPVHPDGVCVVPVVAGIKTPLNLEVRFAKPGTPVNFQYTITPHVNWLDQAVPVPLAYIGGAVVPTEVQTASASGNFNVTSNLTAGTITTSAGTISGNLAVGGTADVTGNAYLRAGADVAGNLWTHGVLHAGQTGFLSLYDTGNESVIESWGKPWLFYNNLHQVPAMTLSTNGDMVVHGGANIGGAADVSGNLWTHGVLHAGQTGFLSLYDTGNEAVIESWGKPWLFYNNLHQVNAMNLSTNGDMTVHGNVTAGGGLTATSVTSYGNLSGYSLTIQGQGTASAYSGSFNNITASQATVPYIIVGSGGPVIISGSGAPTSTPVNGSLYLRTDGTGPNLYVRQNGAWVAK